MYIGVLFQKLFYLLQIHVYTNINITFKDIKHEQFV